MKRFIILISVLLLLTPYLLRAQGTSIDTITQKLKRFDVDISQKKLLDVDSNLKQYPLTKQNNFLIALGNYQVVIARDYQTAANNYYKALNKDSLTVYNRIDAFNGLATIHTYLQNGKMAISLYKEALTALNRNYKDSIKDIITIHNNIGHLYAQEGVYDTAFIYFNRGVDMADGNLNLAFGCLFNKAYHHNNLDSSYIFTEQALRGVKPNDNMMRTFCMLNLGAIEINRGNLKSADSLLSLSKKMATDNNLYSYLGEINIHLGILNAKNGEYNKGINMLESEISGLQNRNDLKQLENVYSWLDIFNSETDNYKDAYRYYRLKIKTDSTFKAQRKLNIQKGNRIAEEFLAIKKMEVQLKRRATQNLYISITLIVLLITSITWFLLHRLKLRNNIKLISTLNDKLNSNVLSLNKERKLTQQELLYKSLKFYEKQKFLENISKELTEVTKDRSGNDIDKKLNRINNLISTNIKDEINIEFEQHFTKVHPNFIKSLIKINPGLTKNEIRLASLIKLNFSTKEISDFTKQSANTINVAKSRLKTKLDIDKNTDLFAYIQSIDSIK
jgi:DNA-binding CsgD family transcriptional regulator